MARDSLLTAHEVERALEGLPGWTGGTDRLTRTVELPEGAADLLDEVHRAEEELNHHAVIEDAAGGLGFTVWTHSRGGVTALDLELAHRINDIFARA